MPLFRRHWSATDFEISPFPVPHSHCHGTYFVRHKQKTFLWGIRPGAISVQATGGTLRTELPANYHNRSIFFGLQPLKTRPYVSSHLVFAQIFFCFSAARFHFTSLTDLGRWEGFLGLGRRQRDAAQLIMRQHASETFDSSNVTNRIVHVLPVGLVELHGYSD